MVFWYAWAALSSCNSYQWLDLGKTSMVHDLSAISCFKCSIVAKVDSLLYWHGALHLGIVWLFKIFCTWQCLVYQTRHQFGSSLVGLYWGRVLNTIMHIKYLHKILRTDTMTLLSFQTNALLFLLDQIRHNIIWFHACFDSCTVRVKEN